jgi:hypothetical protein
VTWKDGFKAVLAVIAAYTLIGLAAGESLWMALLPGLVAAPWICLILFLARDSGPHFPTWPP